MRQRTSDPARQRQARFDRTDHKHPRDARLPPPRARYVGNAIGMSCRPRRRGPTFRPKRGTRYSPESDCEGSTDVNSDAQVAITRSTHTCSSCLMDFDLRKWSPRSDSNRRPSDYESDPNPPPGPAQTHPGCSGAGPISSSVVMYHLVVTPGLPQRLPTGAFAAFTRRHQDLAHPIRNRMRVSGKSSRPGGSGNVRPESTYLSPSSIAHSGVLVATFLRRCDAPAIQPGGRRVPATLRTTGRASAIATACSS